MKNKLRFLLVVIACALTPYCLADNPVTVLATGLNNVASPEYGLGPLVLDGDTIYFTDNASSCGYIKSVPTNGGTVTTVAGGLGQGENGGVYRSTTTMFVDSTSIYAGYNTYENGIIFSIPKAGGSLTTLATPHGGPLIGKIGDNVYYGAGFNSIDKVPASGGTPTQLASGVWARDNAFDTSAVYFQDYGSRSIFRLDATTGALTTLIANLPTEVVFSLAGSYLYAVLDNQIDRVSTNGGAITVLGLQDWSSISDGTYYYFTDRTTISRRAIAGGPVTDILTQPSGSVDCLTTDGSNLYWVDRAGGVGAGEILAMHIPEPASFGLVIMAGVAMVCVVRRRRVSDR